MRDLKVGDRVDMHDGSFVFGICDGEYSTYCSSFNSDRDGLTVVKTGLRTIENVKYVDNKVSHICDILVKNNHGNYWFVASSQCRLSCHTIEIDGKTIELSGASFEALKKQLCG